MGEKSKEKEGQPSCFSRDLLRSKRLQFSGEKGETAEREGSGNGEKIRFYLREIGDSGMDGPR